MFDVAPSRHPAQYVPPHDPLLQLPFLTHASPRPAFDLLPPPLILFEPGDTAQVRLSQPPQLLSGAYALIYARGGDDLFYVPDDLYLIGMMNTAARSLSLVDYALRRRFAFVTLHPKFASEKFAETLAGASDALVRATQLANLCEPL